ncbi:GDSL-type esterase/lipase family protein [Ruania alba]|uniref:Lysophospholipase L1 n=1 Tax=Ruania alba TaxID=648782 RepID=A0A1H5KNU6_9MICO|nr:GDSL-type esterase/lipase family protein [Ruania alba]SEE65761.1 Lysophospholipase L1 [Ruania alba]
MIEYTLDDDALHWTGLVSLEHRATDRWQPWRLPTDAGLDTLSPMLASRARMASGACTRLATDATALELTILATEDQGDRRPVDIVAGGTVVASLLPDESGQVHTDLPAGSKEVEIWWPHWGELTLGPLRTNAPIRASGWRPALRWVTYGSSITHCRSADSPTGTWPALVARAHDWDLTSLGFGGQCHLDPAAIRTIRDRPADLISLCLGINIQGGGTFNARTLGPQVAGAIERIREGHPDTPIAVITPIASPDREQQPGGGGLTLAEVRQIVGEAAANVIERGDPDLHIVDGLQIIGPDDAHLMPDGLHPGPEGYRLMAERIGPVLGGIAGQGAPS